MTIAEPSSRFIPKIKCKECGGGFDLKRNDQSFCCTPCRNAWENRRMTRGAIVYDFLMQMVHRPTSKGLWSAMRRLATAWKAEDREERNGRQSWRNPEGRI